MPFLEKMKSAITPRLATRLPQHLVVRYADVLRRASRLYHFDVSRVNGGTTAPSIPDHMESLRYWSFDLLWAGVSTSAAKSAQSSSEAMMTRTGQPAVASIILPALLDRVGGTLTQYLNDAALRGQRPLGQYVDHIAISRVKLMTNRVREDELLYILRNLVTLRMIPGTMKQSEYSESSTKPTFRLSPRAHLFQFYTILLRLSFLRSPLPSMWMFPSEHAQLFDSKEQSEGSERYFEVAEPSMAHSAVVNGTVDENVRAAAPELDAGDGGELIEVGARDMAKRCLELIGEELGMSAIEQWGRT